MNLAKNSNTIQGLPINLLLSSANFTSCDNSSSSGGGDGLIQLGIGSQINSETGELSGGTIVKAEPDNTSNPNTITFDFAGLKEVIFKNFTTMKFQGDVEVGDTSKGTALPVGVKGSVSTNYNPDKHDRAQLTDLLAQSLKATRKSSSGNTTS